VAFIRCRREVMPPPLQWGAGVRPQTPIKAHTGDVKQSHRNISKVSTGESSKW
jgi:hypothetical protein